MGVVRQVDMGPLYLPEEAAPSSTPFLIAQRARDPGDVARDAHEFEARLDVEYKELRPTRDGGRSLWVGADLAGDREIRATLHEPGMPSSMVWVTQECGEVRISVSSADRAWAQCISANAAALGQRLGNALGILVRVQVASDLLAFTCRR